MEKAYFALGTRPFEPNEAAEKLLDSVSRGILHALTPHLQNASWTRDALETVTADFAEANGTKFGKMAGPLRAALSGRAVTPSVFDMLLVLGKDESLARILDAANHNG